MSNKTLNARIVNKHDVESNWKNSTLIPYKGELIIYDIDATHTHERVKIGDGVKTVHALPFVSDEAKAYTDSIKATITSGTVVAAKAENATKAESATNAEHAEKADTLAGLTATVTELNYTDGVTSNIQEQLNKHTTDIGSIDDAVAQKTQVQFITWEADD